MAEVKINIGGREFEVACRDGEEHFLLSAAQMLDNEASALNDALGRMPESRMLLMAGLMLADKTASLEDRLNSGAAAQADDGRVAKLEKQLAKAQSDLAEARAKLAEAESKTNSEGDAREADDAAAERLKRVASERDAAVEMLRTFVRKIEAAAAE